MFGGCVPMLGGFVPMGPMPIGGIPPAPGGPILIPGGGPRIPPGGMPGPPLMPGMPPNYCIGGWLFDAIMFI